MKIYLTHSKKIDYTELYKALEQSFTEEEFIFPYREKSEPVDSSEFLKHKGCDLLLADVSIPSTGQGIEIGWADSSGIPILFIYKKGSDVSRSFKFLSDKIIQYENFVDVASKLRKVLNEKAKN